MLNEQMKFIVASNDKCSGTDCLVFDLFFRSSPKGQKSKEEAIETRWR